MTQIHIMRLKKKKEQKNQPYRSSICLCSLGKKNGSVSCWLVAVTNNNSYNVYLPVSTKRNMLWDTT